MIKQFIMATILLVVSSQGAYAMGDISITKLKSLSTKEWKALIAEQPATVTSSRKPFAILSKYETEPTPSTTTTTATTTTVPPAPAGATQPTKLLPNIVPYTIMGPFFKVGSTSEPENMYTSKAELDDRYKEYFNVSGDAVRFKVYPTGAHSSGSKYPRSELREMQDTNWTKAAWSNSTGTHTLEVTDAVTHQPTAKPHLVVGQIHDGADDVLQIRWEDHRLFVAGSDNKYNTTLDANLPFGQKFTYRVVAENGRMIVLYAREDQELTEKFNVSRSGSGWYFKAGCYLQSHVDVVPNEDPKAYGEVLIYSFKVTHS